MGPRTIPQPSEHAAPLTSQIIDDTQPSSLAWYHVVISISTVLCIPAFRTWSFLPLVSLNPSSNLSYGLLTFAVAPSLGLGWYPSFEVLAFSVFFHHARPGREDNDDLALGYFSEMSFTRRGIMGKQVQRMMVASSAPLVVIQPISMIIRREDVVQRTYAHRAVWAMIYETSLLVSMCMV